MANTPLKLDWKALLPGSGDAPPLEVEVVVATTGGESRTDPSRLDDNELKEKTSRLSSEIDSGINSRLSDGGVKLLSRLQWRELAKIRKSAEENDGTVRSEMAESSSFLADSNRNVISSGSKPSFAICFPKNLEEKVDSAFSEELRLISGYKDTISKEFGEQMHGRQSHRIFSQPASVPSRKLPSECVSLKDEHGISWSGCWTVESSDISSSSTGTRLSRRLSKRKQASETCGLQGHFKAQDVVLLDDEDGQSMQAIQHVPDEWKESRIYYPSRDAPESVEISYSDIKCLDPESYLSSNIMNFYIQYLQRSLSPVGGSRDTHFIFNTYFYKKLEEAVSCKGDRTVPFLKLRRWCKGLDIFQKAYIFLPIHGDLHWSLVIICIPAKEDASSPIILHLDSLGLHNSRLIFVTVDSYLKEEWNARCQNAPLLEIPTSKRISKRLPHRIEKKTITVPQQKNEYDCGLFVLYFMERFISEAPDRLRMEDLNNAKLFGKTWFKPDEASRLRYSIRDLLIEEFKNSRVTESPASTGCSKSKSCSDID